ncbi:lytic murein transglycosylase [Asticcacaulis taihuensis]|uniref:Lytic murein transglycosylase n=1 Tax=Asticcacaulis taihuensis TaxID=260084 RepID=A0A1G4Q2J8_9CAUL|nr:lytic murein transglycosylase [Asticcacaulis taihuensis]SCW38786.1 lytic murein transglycosylase [Asticcacaulis taihuensis]
MRLRYISLFAILTACSTATPQPEPTPVTPPPLAASSASSSPSASEAATPAPVPAPTAPLPANATFDDWKQSFITKAAGQGFDPLFTAQVLSNVTPQASVTSSDSQQPEFSKPASSYIRQAVTDSRFAAARARLDANPNVPEIVRTSGVPAEVLGGIWTMESDLGRVQGNIDVVSALATLAYNGRRRDWAESELIACLKILRDSGISRDTLKGSWAGAMGQTQFLPDNYLTLGVDGDHDGKVDIWGSDSDALASSANLLAKAGWKPDEEWAVEVMLPVGFDYYLAETAKKTPTEWAALGVKRADGGYWKPAEMNESSTILLPSGAKGPAYLALPNHYVIRKYNNSTAYALAVGFLADGIAGKPGPVTPWPVEQPLSLNQRLKSQEALKAAGFDPGVIDGVIGVGTRSAIREWQRANHLTADGYLSFDLANQFVVMTGGVAETR